MSTNVSPCQPIATHRSKRKTILRFVFILLGTLALILSVIFAYAFVRYRRKDKVQIGTDLLPITTPLRVSYYEIFEATNGYSESNLLGTGSFGSVYSGTLRSGKNVAVKVFNMQLQKAIKSFEVECECCATFATGISVNS
ncbi:putative LRR receptor-like serine/threonine-protein kinase [Forsythia ovata]|uniref:LRR receptor-like serine/threonine-protein kinase n=1 Tax=Forsythia ovata TaxID=205694 RepID=A0ABD1SL01_9LAMI